MRPRHATLTPQELEIMKLVWARDSATVRDVYEALLERRKIAYTTVMTMMNVLETKGYVTKEKSARAFRYRATQAEQTVVMSMVREFVNRVFDGAARPLLVHLSKDRKLTARERQHLRRLIEEAE